MSGNNITRDDRSNKNTNNTIESVRHYFDDEMSSPLSSSTALPVSIASSSSIHYDHHASHLHHHHHHHHQITANPSAGGGGGTGNNHEINANYSRQLRPSSSLIQLHPSVPLCTSSSSYASAVSQSYCSPRSSYPLLPVTLLPTANQMCSGLNFMTNSFLQSQTPLHTHMHNLLPYTVNPHLMLHRGSMLTAINKSPGSQVSDNRTGDLHRRRRLVHAHQVESLNLSCSSGSRCNLYDEHAAPSAEQVNNCSYQYLSNHQCKCNNCHPAAGSSCNTSDDSIVLSDINKSTSVNESTDVIQLTCSSMNVDRTLNASYPGASTDAATVQGQSSSANINDSAGGGDASAICFTGSLEGVKSRVTGVDSQHEEKQSETPCSVVASNERKDTASTSDGNGKSNKRRNRHTFSPKQIAMLEGIFDLSTHYPDTGTLVNLSKKLKLPIERIQVWFQNRRAKYRRGQITQR